MKTINKDMDYTIIYHEKGKDRRPINNYDLNIYTLNEDKLVTFNNVGLNHQNNRKRFNVSSVPGSFIISNVLSPKECENIIQMAEASPQGYVPDEPTTAAKPPVKTTELSKATTTAQVPSSMNTATIQVLNDTVTKPSDNATTSNAKHSVR